MRVRRVQPRAKCYMSRGGSSVSQVRVTPVQDMGDNQCVDLHVSKRQHSSMTQALGDDS